MKFGTSNEVQLWLEHRPHAPGFLRHLQQMNLNRCRERNLLDQKCCELSANHLRHLRRECRALRRQRSLIRQDFGPKHVVNKIAYWSCDQSRRKIRFINILLRCNCTELHIWRVIQILRTKHWEDYHLPVCKCSTKRIRVKLQHHGPRSYPSWPQIVWRRPRGLHGNSDIQLGNTVKYSRRYR